MLDFLYGIIQQMLQETVASIGEDLGGGTGSGSVFAGPFDLGEEIPDPADINCSSPMVDKAWLANFYFQLSRNIAYGDGPADGQLFDESHPPSSLYPVNLYNSGIAVYDVVNPAAEAPLGLEIGCND